MSADLGLKRDDTVFSEFPKSYVEALTIQPAKKSDGC